MKLLFSSPNLNQNHSWITQWLKFDAKCCFSAPQVCSTNSQITVNLEQTYYHFRIRIQKLQMSFPIPNQLPQQDKRLLNILEIKIYDISQNIQIINKQLTSNQIKDSIAQSYSIFNQLKNIFEKLGVKFLYQILKKMQINSIIICSVLTEKLDKINGENIIKSSERVTKKHIDQQQIIRQNTQEDVAPRSKISKIGGINLYNERYARGLQYYQVADPESIELLAGRCRVKQSKKMKETLQKELQNKADIQVQNISQEITKYINDYKQNSKIHNSVSYEKQLEQIIDFFKTSERQAINFLSKSPNNNNEYTEDFINRINDLEIDIKLKEKEQKFTFVQKMNFIIIKLKEKSLEIERKYQEKCKKLKQIENNLKKQTNTISSQTYDGYESRLKQLQSIIKQHQERYNILTQIKNNEINYEFQYYQIKNQYQIKVNENNKIKVYIHELEEEAHYLKKIIRENKESISIKDIDKYRKNKNKIAIKSKKNLDEEKKEVHEEEVIKKNKNEKRLRKYQKMGTSNSSAFRASYDTAFDTTENDKNQINKQQNLHYTDNIGNYQEKRLDKERSFSKNTRKDEEETTKIIKSIITQSNRQNLTQERELKQSNFKRNLKNITNEQQQKKVYFNHGDHKEDFVKETFPQIQDSQKNSKQQCNQMKLSPKLSMKILKDDNSSRESSRRSKRNILRQRKQLETSIRSIEGNQSRPISLVASRKYLVSKQQKYRNKIENSIKLNRMDIVQNIALTIYPSIQLPIKKEPSFLLRKEQKSLHTKEVNQLAIGLKNKTYLGSKNNTYSNFTKRREEKVYDIDKLTRSNYPFKNSSNTISSKQRAPTEEKRSMKKIITDLKHLKNEENKPLKTKQNTKETKINKTQTKEMFFGKDLNNIVQVQKSSEYPSPQKSIMTNYILNQIKINNLDLNQLKKISKIMEEDENQTIDHVKDEYKRKQSQSHNRNSKLQINLQMEKNSQYKQGFTQNKFSTDRDGHPKGQRRIFQIKDNQREQNQIFQKISQYKQEQALKILKISPKLLRKIQEAHIQITKCCKRDEICQHLTKYFNIIKMINDNNQKIGNSLKIHIEVLGIIDQSISERTIKENMTQFSATEHYELEKNRILPTINSTCNQFYKPKSKHYAYK